MSVPFVATETIFQNLFSLVSQTQLLNASGVPAGGPVFSAASSRRLPQVSNVGQAEQPAIFQIELHQDLRENVQAAAREELHCMLFVFFRNTGGPDEVASTQMNTLRDAVLYQLQQNTLAADGVTVVPKPGGMKQTLGGVVYHARVIGQILQNEGTQNNQGAIVIPVSILRGM
jgi:hypothetical protein